jgi:hypothetical protein
VVQFETRRTARKGLTERQAKMVSLSLLPIFRTSKIVTGALVKSPNWANHIIE